MKAFAQDLAAGREQAADRRDPEWCVLRAVADSYGLSTDPLDEVGVKGPWHQASGSVDTAIRLLVQVLGYSQAAAAGRMGYSAGKAHRAGHIALMPWDLEALAAAEDLHGGPLT